MTDYKDVMTRTPLILIPGLGSDYGLWEAQIRDLADIADIQVGDTLQDDSLPAIARRILDAAPDRFALAGLSMGGYLSQEIMRQAPERVTRLALLDTSARPDTPEQTAGRRAAVEATKQYDYTMLARMSLPGLIAAEAPDHVRDAVVAMSVRVGPEVYTRQQEATAVRPDSRPLLPTITVPTLIVVGALDTLTPPHLAEEMRDLIPGARLEVIPGAGHLPPIEKPDDVTAVLRKWLTV
jgi:pimeloyl-ACP methyl ester carboxylesterase